MALNYERIGWENAPSTNTPIDAGSLNHMDNGILAVSNLYDVDVPYLKEQVAGIPAMLDSYLADQIGVDVGKWLDDHVTPGGSTIVVDDTLTISGAAADSKTVGDALGTKANTSDVNAALAAKADAEDLDEAVGDISQLENALTAAETAINAMEIVDNASGAIASFADGSDGVPVKGLKVSIEPIQAGSGDPSPDNVRPISGRSEVIVTRAGKNLFDVDAITTITVSDAGLERNGVIFRKSGTYTVSAQNSGDFLYCRTFNNDGSNKNTYNIVSGTKITNATFTVHDGEYFAVYDAISDTVANTKAKFNAWKCQVETGATANPYEPYNGQQITIQLGQTVYGGTLDVTNGTLTVDSAIVDLGTLDWTYDSMNQRWSGETGNALYTNYRFAGFITEKYASDTTGAAGDNNKIMMTFGAFYLYSTDSATKPSGMCVYPLATPQTYQLTPQQVTTLLGLNNIWSDADSVSVDYVADTKLYIAKAIADALS